MLRRVVFVAAGSVLTLMIAVAGALYWSWDALNAPLVLPPQGVVFDIENGSALATVTADLEGRGIIAHPHLVNWYARLSGKATGIKAGEYALVQGQTVIGLLDQLGRGDVVLHRFTIIEGWRFDELLMRLRSHSAVVASDLSADEIMAELGRAGEHPEGQFLPDTYSFPRGMRDIEVLRLAHTALWKLVDESWNRRFGDGVLQSPYQGLILASIIEKETALDRERGLVSGVFHERLRRGMRLQTDPTVIYGLGDAFDGNLTRRHLTDDTPYNTYTRAGLPPSPIAMAGRASIEAAFAPVESGALYFVATGDPDGSHAFSSTLEEHNAAVRRYQTREQGND